MLLTIMLLAATLSVTPDNGPAPMSRDDQVREASKDVMPFSMGATQHIFRKTDDGGVQTVVVRQPDEQQTTMVRQHLRQIADQFRARDFTSPTHIHGETMPGLSEMRASEATDLDVTYADVSGGGQITYFAHTRALVDAIHRWFDAQVSDHGRDARTEP